MSAPVCCPCCFDHFRAPPSISTPMVFDCGHTVCGRCNEAVSQCDQPLCPVCTRPVRPAIVDAGFAAFSEVMYQASLAESGVSGAAEEEPGFDVDPSLVPLPPSLRCANHADTPATMWNDDNNTAICEACSLEPSISVLLPLNGFAPALTARLATASADCDAGIAALDAARASLASSSLALKERCEASIASYAKSVETMKAALDKHRDQAITRVRKVCDERVKALNTQAEELQVSVQHLRSTQAMIARTLSTAQDITSLCRVQTSAVSALKLKSSYTGPCVSTMLALSASETALLAALESFSVIFESGPVAACSTVDGPGKGFSLPGDTEAALAQNVILVRCNDVNGEPAGLTSTDDVELAFSCAMQPAGSDAAVGAVVAKSMKGPGLVEIVYTITASTDVSGIRASVYVCGSTSSSLCWDVRRYTGCVRLPSANFFHIAISPDNSTLAASAFDRSEIQLFDLKSDTVIRSLTASRRQGGLARRWPAEPGGNAEFVHPFRMCFTQSGTLLVATTTSSGEISEITVTGDELRVIQCSVPSDGDAAGEPAPYCVDCDGGLVVVGRRGVLANRIIISSYTSCTVVDSFGLKGERAGQIGVVHSVRLVPNRDQVAICESNRVSLFKVDGTFIRVVGDNQISTSCVDAAFDNNGFLHALDSQLQRICVFEPNTSAKLLRVLGRRGQGACKFKSPSAVCFANDHWQLYVLDIMSTRVQVFS